MVNNKNKFPRGSEWRMWDLHLHSPLTLLNNQFTKLPDGEPDWEQYISKLETLDLAVIGITDYFCIEGYKKIIEYRENGRLKNIQTILPNVEFRLNSIIASKKDGKQPRRLNFHVIFSDELDPKDIEEHFLHDIEFFYEGNPQAKDDRKKLKLSNLENLGTRLIEEHQKFSNMGLTPLEVGAMQAVVNHESITQCLSDSRFNGKYIVVFPEQFSNLIDWDGQDHHTRKGLLQKSDVIFSSNEKTRNWCLGQIPYTEGGEKFIEEFKSLKPCIHGTDAHKLADIGKPCAFRGVDKHDCEVNATECELRYCWIKADPTFQGLKQILFEPEDRVAIGYEKPEQKKTYYLIDKIRFIDNTGQDNFPSSYIPVNQNLITIIGGKSTGKSLLLYYTAKTIDSKEVDNRFTDLPSANQYDFHHETDFNFEVVWADGETTLLKQAGAERSESERKILYIPQNYLNKLSEKNVQSKDTLNKFVRDVLLQDDSIKHFYEESIQKIKEYYLKIPVSITSLFQTQLEASEISENIKQTGKEEGIKKYLEQLQREADKIKSKSGLNDQELEQYESLLKQEKEETTKIGVLSEDKRILLSFKQKVSQQLDSLIESRDIQKDYFGDDSVRSQFTKALEGLNSTKIETLSSIDSVEDYIDKQIEDKNRVLSEIKNKLKPYMDKVSLQKELTKKNDEIKEEQQKLNRIALDKKNLKSKQSNVAKEKLFLLEIYQSIFAVYDSIRNEFKKYENNFEDISLNVSIGFNESRFNEEVINSCLNKKDIKRVLNGVEWMDEYEYKYNPENHINFITELFNNVIDAKIKAKKGQSNKDIVSKILDNFFKLDFKITYKNDPLDKMSPGKKGLVLLRLLIDLSNEEWPILLDQPEDDLDNRSVYKDLVAFVKHKKKNRQIIVVTHNPNLVVGADAEEVIVANQDGQERGQENRKYKFEYISGALENTYKLTEKQENAILYRRGIREHVCEVLEGGEEAFLKREKKYSFDN